MSSVRDLTAVIFLADVDVLPSRECDRVSVLKGTSSKVFESWLNFNPPVTLLFE